MMAQPLHAVTGDEVQPHLVFDRVTKVFADGTRALEGVSFTVPRGQFCVVLGPSGSGKSTLLRCVNGLTEVAGGGVFLGGIQLTRRARRNIRRRVAMVHQLFNLVERGTVASNVLAGAVAEVPFWRVVLGWYPTDLRDRACDRLARVGLEPQHLSRRAYELSGGQQQRVGLARALLMSPEVVLADEPVASLDPAISREVLSLLRDGAAQERATVLCSLHQVDLACEFADRIIGLRDGRVVFDGRPDQFDGAAERALYSGLEAPAPSTSTVKKQEAGTRTSLENA